MSNRSVKFAPALIAGVVAGVSLATMTDLRAQVISAAEAATPATQAAADGCLSAPQGATPSGSHWYYRIDRVTKRQCWYLREESDTGDDKFARAAPPASAPASTAEEPAAPQQRTITRKSIADARAEWISQPTRAEPNPPARIEPRPVAAVATPAVQNSPRAMPNVLAPAPLSSMRWNDAPVIRASANPTDLQLAAATPPAVQPPQAAQVQQVQLTAADQAAPIAAEAAPVPAKPKASLQKLLLVIAAALALAGLTVSAIVRIGRMRARRAIRRKRRAMWDTAKTKRRSPQPMFHDEDARLRRTEGVYNQRVPQDRPRVAQERPRVPQERTRVPQERPTRVPQERPRPPQERRHVPQDRVPQDRERELQVTEMLARLARSAHT
jgi:hypothetical protein